MNDGIFEAVELIEQAEQYKKKMGELHVKIIKLELEVENTIVRHLNSKCNNLDSMVRMVRMMSVISQRRKRIRKLKRRYEGYKKEMDKISSEMELLRKREQSRKRGNKIGENASQDKKKYRRNEIMKKVDDITKPMKDYVKHLLEIYNEKENKEEYIVMKMPIYKKILARILNIISKLRK